VAVAASASLSKPRIRTVEAEDQDVFFPDHAGGEAAHVDPGIGQDARHALAVAGLVGSLDPEPGDVRRLLEAGRGGRLCPLRAGDAAQEDHPLARYQGSPPGDEEDQVDPGIGERFERRRETAGAIVDRTGPNIDTADGVRHCADLLE
jgi:hypothetical protein